MANGKGNCPDYFVDIDDSKIHHKKDKFTQKV